MEECLDQKLNFTAQLLAVKMWCQVHQEKNVQLVSEVKPDQKKLDETCPDAKSLNLVEETENEQEVLDLFKEENLDNLKYNVNMHQEAVLYISKSVNKLIA